MPNGVGWFIAELRRRRVYHVGAAYAVVGFVVWQVADIAVPGLGLPESAMTLILVLTILGFPIALVLAWAYEVSPEGIRLEGVGGAREGSATSTIDGEAPNEETGSAGTASESTPEVLAVPSGGASVAVLPFANLGPSPEGDYFSDGVTEEITHVLARSPNLRVVARTSAFAFKSESADVREVAARLGVSHLLEGSVRRAGERLRVTVQLIEAEGGMHLWSERYDREMDDVFAIQDEIADHVAARLAGALTEPKRPVPSRVETSLEAYDAYLRGREQHARLDPRSYATAVERYQEAIRLDPDYAPAHAALAQVFTFQSFGLGVPSADTMPLAREAADRALALSPTLAAAHLARGIVAMFHEWDFERAWRGIERAIELSPSHAEAYVWLEFYWSYVGGRFEEAVAATRKAQELDPLDPSVKVRLGCVYYIFGRYGDAVEYLEALKVRDPNGGLVNMSLGDALARNGDLPEAVEAVGRAVELLGGIERAPNGPLGVMGAVCGLAGEVDRAHRVLEILVDRARAGRVTAVWEACVRAALGDLDGAFEGLARAVEQRDAAILFLNAAPRALKLRGDPRFDDVRRRVGLPRLD